MEMTNERLHLTSEIERLTTDCHELQNLLDISNTKIEDLERVLTNEQSNKNIIQKQNERLKVSAILQNKHHVLCAIGRAFKTCQ